MTLNFFKKEKIHFFLIIFLLNIQLFGQNKEFGSPFIYNIPPKDYGFENSNFSITQDNDGLMYFGNLSGILQFDGKTWKLIKISGKPILAADKNGKIFVGGYNEIGFLEKKYGNKIEYISLNNKLPSRNFDFGTINKVICYNDFVLYCSDKFIFKYSENKVELINSSNDFLNVFSVNDELYIYKYGYGLLKYNGKLFKLLPDGHFFKDKSIKDIIYYNNKLLIKVDGQKGFYLYDYNSIKEYNPSYSNFLDDNGYSKGIELNDGNYMFTSKRCGAIIVNRRGEKITAVNKSKGLYSNNINDVYCCKANNIWLALNNGISKIEYPSAFSFYNESYGFVGGIYSVIKFNANLYISTSLGAYKYESHNDTLFKCENFNLFTHIGNIDFQCYNFYKLFGKLFLTTENGLFEITGNDANLISAGKIRAIHQLKKDTSIILLGRYDGIHLLKYSKNEFIDIGKINGFDKYIRTIAEDKNGNVWLGSDYEGVHKLIFNDKNYLNPTIQALDNTNGLDVNTEWVDVYTTSKGVIFSTNVGTYQYNQKTTKFFKDSTINNKDITWVYPIVEDEKNNLWYSSGDIGKFEKQTGFSKNYNNNVLYKLSQFTIESIFPDKDDVVWFAGFDGLIRFDAKNFKIDSNKKEVLIRKIVFGNDSVISFQKNNIVNDYVFYYNDSSVFSIPFKYNKVKFEFSFPSYENDQKVQYQYMLDGFDNNWSDITTINFKEYTNLSEGIYIFNIKAIDLNNNETYISIFKFEILSPFYRRWWAYAAYVIIMFLFAVMITKWRSYIFEKERNKLDKIISERTEELVLQKERAESLVNNILPRQTAEELKSVGRVSRKKYKMVTVLFSDIQEFTKIAEDISQEKLLDELDKYFLHFDNVVDRYNIEKIKTIGDAYMCAGGIPQKNRTNPIEVVLAALEMRKYLNELKQKKEEIWNVRIGIHTGSVIAGVVGSKKYSYDIWGDTVNIASRMESLGQPGEINISETTYDMVKEYFDCELRGKVPAKYKGEINMYFVKGIRKEYSDNGDGVTANIKFKTKLQLIRFDDLDELIMTKLEKGLPKTLYYHDLKHTIDVCTQVEIIGRTEKVSDEEMLLLKTAALFHDAGFLIGYDDHEFLGIKMAKETLPRFGYSEEQIKVICDLIFATRMPPSPTNLLEQIICDADLDYLGRPDFIPVSQKLFRELFERNKIKSVEEWNKMQIKFIEGHQYFTETARKLRSENKTEQLYKLKKMMNLA